MIHYTSMNRVCPGRSHPRLRSRRRRKPRQRVCGPGSPSPLRPGNPSNGAILRTTPARSSAGAEETVAHGASRGAKARTNRTSPGRGGRRQAPTDIPKIAASESSFAPFGASACLADRKPMACAMGYGLPPLARLRKASQMELSGDGTSTFADFKPVNWRGLGSFRSHQVIDAGRPLWPTWR